MTGADSLGCERTRTVSLQVVSRFGAADAGAATATTAAVAAAMLTPANAALRPLSRSLGMCPYLSRSSFGAGIGPVGCATKPIASLDHSVRSQRAPGSGPFDHLGWSGSVTR